MTLISSPILEQAGFIKRKAAAVVEQWVAQPDGETQVWVLSEPINVVSGDVIEMSFIGGEIDTRARYFYAAESFQFGIYSESSGTDHVISTLQTSTVTTLNGSPVVYGSTLVPKSGKNNLSSVVNNSGPMVVLGSRTQSASQKVMIPIYNFRVIRNGVVIHEIPLTNKAQGATQLATVGNINAFMPNYTDAVWRKP